MNTFLLNVTACDRVFFEGYCRQVILPLEDGEKGIQAHHENMVFAVNVGELRIQTEDGAWITGVVGSGFAQVRRPVAEKRIDKPQPEAYIDLEAQLRSLTTEQLQIVAAIDAPGTQVDLIIEKTQLPASKVLAELTVLQIRGVVRQEPGKRFSLNVRAGTAQQS